MDKDEQRLFSERGERLAEYRDALAAKDQELERVKGEVNGWRETAKAVGEVDHHGLALAITELKQAHADLLVEAKWAMEKLKSFLVPEADGCGCNNCVFVRRAHAFLARPDVQARMKGAT